MWNKAFMGDFEAGVSLKIKEFDTFNSLSPAAIELLNKLDKPETELQEVINLVLLDRVLYAGIMKYSQSAALGLRRTPESLDEAINYLGFYGLRDLIYIINSRNFFCNVETWYRNIFCAFCSRKLSQKLNFNQKDCSDNYIAALLFDLGSNIFHTRFPKKYRKIYDLEDLNERHAMETSMYGASSADISFDLLHSYSLSESILTIIKNQSKGIDSKEYTINNAILNLSYKLSFYELIDETDLEEILSIPLHKKFGFDHLNLNTNAIKKLHAGLKELITF